MIWNCFSIYGLRHRVGNKGLRDEIHNSGLRFVGFRDEERCRVWGFRLQIKSGFRVFDLRFKGSV
jgi:hypothetical protein